MEKATPKDRIYIYGLKLARNILGSYFPRALFIIVTYPSKHNQPVVGFNILQNQPSGYKSK